MSRKIFILGEHLARDEEDSGIPFSGMSGGLLRGVLSMVGIDIKRDCSSAVVFPVYPPSADIKNICVEKDRALPGWPAVIPKFYPDPVFAQHFTQLESQITAATPNLIIALGNSALWFLAKRTETLAKFRGAPLMSRLGFKTITTHSPYAVFRDWSLRPVFTKDLEKAAFQSQFPEIRRPHRELWIKPTIEDLHEFGRKFIFADGQWLSPYLSIDIETTERQITEIGFAPSRDRGIVIPFLGDTYPEIRDGKTILRTKSYWPTKSEELAALTIAAQWAQHPHVIGQNFSYDMNHMWTNYGIPVPGFRGDTMLLHHALQPELPKSLQFLGSIYTQEPSWKFMRHAETVKRED